MAKEKTANNKNQAFIEKMNKGNLIKLSNRGLWISFVLFFLVMIYIIFISNKCTNFFNFIDYKNEILFLFSLIFTFIFGVFTISAYFVARKVEESIRNPLYSFKEFIKKSSDEVVSKKPPKLKIMISYPYFGFFDEIRTNGGDSIFNHLNDYAHQTDDYKNTSVEILIPSEKGRKEFFEKLKIAAQGDESIKSEIDDEIACTNIKKLINKKNATKNNKFDIFTQPHRNKMHMFWCDHKAVFGVMNEPKKILAIETRDQILLKILEQVFEEFKNHKLGQDGKMVPENWVDTEEGKRIMADTK